jgi:molybdopterin/thiamine biosynthesis adenylyltransferase
MSAISEKLVKVNESFTVYRYDNGFMVEVGGRNDDDDWKDAKVLCTDQEGLFAAIHEILALPKAE